MRKLTILLAAIALAGCAQRVWIKNGISQQEANQDRYDCLRESQQRVSNAQVSIYGGVAQNTVITNQELYNACLAARGYTLQDAQTAGQASYSPRSTNSRNGSCPPGTTLMKDNMTGTVSCE